MEPASSPEQSTPAADYIRDLLDQAEVLHKQDRYTESEAFLRRALQLVDSHLPQDCAQLALACDRLAYNRFRQDDLGEAEALFRRALELRREAFGEEDFETATSFNNLGLLVRIQGRLAEAEVLIGRARELFTRRLGESDVRTLLALKNLALIALDLGRYLEAESCLRRVLEQLSRLNEGAGLETARCLYSLANVLMAQNRYSEAELLYRHAADLLRQAVGHGSYDAARILFALSISLRVQGRTEEAEVLIREALATAAKVFGTKHFYFGATLAALGAILSAQGKLSEAELALRESLEIQLPVLGSDNPEVVEGRSMLGAILAARDNDEAAVEVLRLACEGFELARVQVSYEGLERATRGAARSPFARLAACLARRGSALEAWEALERSLARGLLDELHARRSRVLEAEETTRLRQLTSDFLRHASQSEPSPGERDASRRQLLEFEAKLSAKYGVSAGEVFSISRIQSSLTSDSALLEWVDPPRPSYSGLGAGEAWAFVLLSSGPPICIKLQGSDPGGAWNSDDDALAHRARNLLARMPSPERAPELNAALRQLHQQRLRPVEEALGKLEPGKIVRKLVVVPVGPLAGIPIEALTDSYEVTYTPSGTIHAWLCDEAKTRPQVDQSALLVLGDPAPSPAEELTLGFQPLRGARVEAETIAGIFCALRPPRNYRCDLLLGSNASEAQLSFLTQCGRLADYRYLHFATHAVMDDTTPLRSFLVLARDQLPDPLTQATIGKPVLDGSLTAEEVLRTWKLQADLVVLSGCQTALGKSLGGEGTLGLALGFITAGARSVIVSLWKVDDTATSLLMCKFYECLMQGCVSRSKALRDAKSWLRTLTREDALERAAGLGTLGIVRGATEEPVTAWDGLPPGPQPFDAPYYWAAFILFGAADENQQGS